MNTEARRYRPPYVFAVIVMLIGITFFGGGIELIAAGGSYYYLLAGLAITTSGLLLWRGNRFGSRVFGWLLLATLLWSLWEAGPDPWALVPRLLTLSVIGLCFLTPWVRRGLYSPLMPPPILGTTLSKATAVAVAVVAVAVVAIAARSTVELMPARFTAATAEGATAITDWRSYGNTDHGTRFAQLDQITPANVGKLQPLWHVRTQRNGQFKATPIQVGDLLYVCTAFNVIQALDAETGERRWEFDPKSTAKAFGFTQNCRSVSYYEAPADYSGDCPARIVMGTTDARLFAVDAKTGARCTGFGDNGEISLLPGMGEVKQGFYYVTSAPTIARGLAIVGGWVVDNQEVNEPSGVIRAYDVMTGKFKWAWDLGRPGINTEAAEGETYTRGTPNMWSLSSYDDKLGLVYLPLGNATPDYVGMHRTPLMEKFSSSVVALDVADGSVRWSFQTVHHDIWDYDVPSQPVLIDLPQADGSVIPALVQGTKRGELFLLDRRDGKPVSAVEEKPVPQGAVPEDHTSPTQPFSVGMPNFRDDLSEAAMWGITPFDQMWCRIQFRKLRYEGHFTPPSTRGTIQFPGNAGGFNWGSVAVSEDNQLLVASPLIMANRLQLVPRAKVTADMRGGLQIGTPYAMTTRPFMSPLAVPCQQPPYSKIAVIDLQTQKMLWSKALGTANESGPFGMRIGVPLPMGVPQTLAGTVVTRGGVIFVGSTMDRYFRALDLKTGKELWRDYLPGTSQATPMSYLSPKSRRQIVVIAVPNASRRFGVQPPNPQPGEEDPQGGHLIAYALPLK
jgi:quinate dehydrogenase (quinone)